MKAVELFPAFERICDSCGRNQFASGVRVDLMGDERLEALEAFGMTSDDTGDFLEMPTTVKCRYCGEVFETVVINETGGRDELGAS